MTNTAKYSGWRAFAAFSFVLTLSLPSLASWNAIWTGGDGNWNVASYWQNNTPPDTTGYASFKNPNGTPLTVTLNNVVDTYVFYFNGNRTAGVLGRH